MKIAFMQPSQFYRTPNKTNPFFDPIMKVCDEAGVSYRIFELAKHLSPTSYKDVRSSYWLLYWEIFGCRLIKWFHLSERPLWLFLGWWANILSFGRFRADLYITVAGVNLEILQGINPKARLVDLQHGVIYSKHSGYFDSNCKLWSRLFSNPQREYWLYGEGYKNCFYRHPDNTKLLGDRVRIIGDVLGASMPVPTIKSHERDAIVFSLQFTHDYDAAKLVSIKQLIEQMFDRIVNAGLQKKYKILLKHHPRYNDCIDLTSWKCDYPWAQFTTEATAQLVARAAYHVTMHSTTTFEYASAGVPTCFLWDETNPEGRIVMLEDYQYIGLGDFNEMMAYFEGDKALQEKLETRVRAWFRCFYTPFDAMKFKRMLITTTDTIVK